MANNFVNGFASVVTAGEFYQSNASDATTGPQTVYTANNGSGVNSILIELDAANTCLLYTSPSPRDSNLSRMPSSA